MKKNKPIIVQGSDKHVCCFSQLNAITKAAALHEASTCLLEKHYGEMILPVREVNSPGAKNNLLVLWWAVSPDVWKFSHYHLPMDNPRALCEKLLLWCIPPGPLIPEFCCTVNMVNSKIRQILVPYTTTNMKGMISNMRIEWHEVWTDISEAEYLTCICCIVLYSGKNY